MNVLRKLRCSPTVIARKFLDGVCDIEYFQKMKKSVSKCEFPLDCDLRGSQI